MAAGRLIKVYSAKRRGRPLGSKNKPKVSKTIKQTVTTPAMVRRIARKVIMKNTEQKFFDLNIGKTELYHNSYVINSFKHNTLGTNCLPPQGDTDNSRDGNAIYVSGISLPMMLYTKGDRLNTKFRVICFRYSQGYNPFATYESLFDNISGNCMLDKVNPDLVKVIFDKIIGNSNLQTLTGGSGNDEQTRFRKFWIPIKKKFVFRDDASQAFNRPLYNIGLVVLAYDTYGSIQNTENIGAVQLWQRLYYKDV